MHPDNKSFETICDDFKLRVKLIVYIDLNHYISQDILKSMLVLTWTTTLKECDHEYQCQS